MNIKGVKKAAVEAAFESIKGLSLSMMAPCAFSLAVCLNPIVMHSSPCQW
jgi:hypothetical protein